MSDLLISVVDLPHLACIIKSMHDQHVVSVLITRDFLEKLDSRVVGMFEKRLKDSKENNFLNIRMLILHLAEVRRDVGVCGEVDCGESFQAWEAEEKDAEVAWCNMIREKVVLEELYLKGQAAESATEVSIINELYHQYLVLLQIYFPYIPCTPLIPRETQWTKVPLEEETKPC